MHWHHFPCWPCWLSLVQLEDPEMNLVHVQCEYCHGEEALLEHLQGFLLHCFLCWLCWLSLAQLDWELENLVTTHVHIRCALVHGITKAWSINKICNEVGVLSIHPQGYLHFEYDRTVWCPLQLPLSLCDMQWHYASSSIHLKVQLYSIPPTCCLQTW